MSSFFPTPGRSFVKSEALFYLKKGMSIKSVVNETGLTRDEVVSIKRSIEQQAA